MWIKAFVAPRASIFASLNSPIAILSIRTFSNYNSHINYRFYSLILYVFINPADVAMVTKSWKAEICMMSDSSFN